MNKTFTNHDIPPAVWKRHFSRTELRDLAISHGIMRGRDKLTTAQNLYMGKTESGVKVTFPVEVNATP